MGQRITLTLADGTVVTEDTRTLDQAKADRRFEIGANAAGLVAALIPPGRDEPGLIMQSLAIMRRLLTGTATAEDAAAEAELTAIADQIAAVRAAEVAAYAAIEAVTEAQGIAALDAIEMQIPAS